MKREILVSASPQESWVALLEDDRLVELMHDRPDQGRLVGDIFLGRVEAVLPGIQAAFVNIGTEKAGFLHASDLDSEDEDEDNGENGGRRKSRKEVPIQDVIRQGQDLLVQVTKEPIGTKGPRLTTQISMPGRFLVFMPGSSHVGVSRKIEERGERARLRKLAKEIVPPGSGGVIVRTVGEELNRNTFDGEFKRLHQAWKEIQRKAETAEAPALVHGEAKLISGVIRDLFSDKFDSLTVDNREIHAEITRYV
ncbi:MAG: S1 RNA-binding domain-containing protein, partial [Gemmatimonadales bacterium]